MTGRRPSIRAGYDRPIDHALAPLSFDHVVLPLDGSSFSAAALPTASAVAARFGARLVTVSVAEDERDAERLRRQALEELGAASADTNVHVLIGSDPADVITSHAEELNPSVVCMSTRGRGRIDGTLIGSVARAVLQRSKAPILAVGPQADRPPALVGRPRRRPTNWPEPLSVGPVVACVDGSVVSEAALPEAARWATALEAGLSILTVAEDAVATPGGGSPNRFGPPDPRGYVEDLVSRWGETVFGTEGEVFVDPIGVASALAARLAASPARLVVLTTHARTGLDRLRLGATAADIVRTSTVPALVVPVADM